MSDYDQFLDYKNFEDFWLKRLSYDAQPINFTESEILWAILETEYKYFGVYEFSDAQKAAVEILVWVAQEKLK